ncbi:rCG43116 [Rattus norvegicus]|uniref:RCG43116 n=1 Tax=Rattus norvegicus TaxID=10116 RepID=A6IWJ3_RAT|nr:rCG43116 [Rattus norvegicus]
MKNQTPSLKSQMRGAFLSSLELYFGNILTFNQLAKYLTQLAKLTPSFQ